MNKLILAMAIGIGAPVAAQTSHFAKPEPEPSTKVEVVGKPLPKGEGMIVEIGGFSVSVGQQQRSGSGAATIFVPLAKASSLSGRRVDVTVAYAITSAGWTEGRVVAIINGFLLPRVLPKPPVNGSKVERLHVSLNGELVRTYGGVRIDLVAQGLTRGRGRLEVEPRSATLLVK